MNIIAQLEADIQHRHLSQHQFYQLWNEGKVSKEALQEYAKEYFQFVQLFPRLVSRIHSNTPDEADRLKILENLNEEENPELPHTELWVRFAEGIGVSREDMFNTKPLPATKKMLATMQELADKSYLEGCAAVLGYEGQISEIAILKQKGLEQHYDIHDKRALEFFEEHGEVDLEHQKTWKELIAKNATEEQYPAIRNAIKTSLDAQWKLLDGIYDAYCEAC
ncbi:MAG: CADD family putative folate metabolism protein [Candidatus Woesearchaeota archaeon]|nr:CADD family putative folate metabolism protein [Candidatus Woesearchaeota archaeon]